MSEGREAGYAEGRSDKSSCAIPGGARVEVCRVADRVGVGFRLSLFLVFCSFCFTFISL